MTGCRSPTLGRHGHNAFAALAARLRVRLLVAALLVVCMAAAASAHPESAAPSLHPAVALAWHEPEVVEPGTQWSGFLQLRPGHDVGKAWYQVCDAGDGVCFAPLHAAQAIANDTYRFDTVDYLANGRPVDWQPGWRVGVRWFLADTDAPDSNGTWVPMAPADPNDAVAIEDLYLTFDIPSGKDRGAPGVSIGLLAICMLGATTLAARAPRGRT